MNNIAIIPARGGSKRIPRKNIRDFLGKPIIAYSIEAAINSGLFEEVMVSTDDDEIANVSIKYGAKVPFMRSSKNSDDFSTAPDVMLEVLDEYVKLHRKFVKGCCVFATSPLITTENMSKAYQLLVNESFDSVFPVVKFAYPIQRALQIVSGRLTMVHPEYVATRSQDLPARYHDAGQFVWFDTEALKRNRILFSSNSGAIQISEMEVQDIDEPSDWGLAELKYRLSNKIKV